MPRRERPLDEGDTALLRFARDLRLLREEAGGPTYRELSDRARYSEAALSLAAGGRKLPSLAVALAYVRACGGAAGEWEERWREVAADLGPPPAADPEEEGPYVGLAAFQPSDADRFFGREHLVEELRSSLAEHRVVVVVGASGSGKSSLLRAGLVARLDGPVLLFTPGAKPLRECATRLAVLTGGPVDLPVDDPRALHRAIRGAVPGDGEVVVVVDQFEEVFTLCHDLAERAAFIDQVVTAARSHHSACRVVLGVRADFYGHCTAHPRLLEALRESQVTVGAMTAEELRAAVVQPAVRSGLTAETALVARVVADATGQPGVLPLVSHALREAWRRRRGNAVTLKGYEAAGGVEQAVAHSAETVYTGLSDDQRTVARHLFLRLCAFGEGTEDTKRRVRRDEFGPADHPAHEVLDELAHARLVVLDGDGVEIAHEALIRSWPRLRAWLAEDREGLRVHRALTEATAAWLALDRDPGALYRGLRLDTAEDWAGRDGAALTAVERRFLDLGVDARSAERTAVRRRARRLRHLVALLAVLLLLAVGTSVYAVTAARTVAGQRNTALSQKVAGQSAEVRAGDPGLAARLSLAAFRLAPTAEARGGLLSTTSTPDVTRLAGHEKIVESVAVSPNGRIVATASADRTARLWDVSDRRAPVPLATLATHTAALWTAVFTPAGTLLATTSEDGTARLWDVTDPRHPVESATLTGHTGPVLAAVFSPDGTVLATASADHTAKLWNVADPGRAKLITTITGHTDVVTSVAFGRQGRTLATASWDGTVRIWDVADQHEVSRPAEGLDRPGSLAFRADGAVLAAVSRDFVVRLWNLADPTRPEQVAAVTDGTAHAVVFSPDGRSLATAGLDRTVRLWDVTDPRAPRQLTALHGHTGPVVSVRFTPDGRSVVSSGFDRVVRLWDLPGPVLGGHDSAVYAVGFSPTGRVLATSSFDGAVRLWDARDVRRARPAALLTAHSQAVNAVVFSPDGQVLATAGLDRVVRLWRVGDLDHIGEPVVLAGYADSVQTAAFSPDGRLLVTGSADHAVRLWDVSDLAGPRELSVHTGTDNVETVAFSPDGRTLAAGTSGQVVRLWDVSAPDRPRELKSLSGHTDAVKSLSFSPDGRVLATGSGDHSVRLWDVSNPQDGREVAHLTGHTETVHSVAMSSDGRTLATASADGTTRLWDVRDPARATGTAVLSGHTARIYAVAFHPDGHTLATAGEDRTTRLWETDPDRAATWICATAPPITPEEWDGHFEGAPFQPSCG
ncbi:WD40 repeat domain-containing protein [Umezawaea endophytica]|uniref:WD40 repeat domain-containing protein n=1 Tax=Umezawaea endophytica TaxID=1654476 RepID=A0A9X3AD49_9PSEU|nr:WD40 repeat domain-containing protein [Umezawaea endophytica]MCS7475231.1 WD40 repeat domain-containing protein [Umezawaea endophytica]